MGTLQVGGTTLGTKNTSTNKIELENSFLKESGSIVQVQHTQYGTGASETGNMTSLSIDTNYILQASGNSQTGTGILQVTITPKISGSKIWLQAHWFGEINGDKMGDFVFFFFRDTSGGSSPTKLASGVTAGSPSHGQIGISTGALSYGQNNADTTPESAFFQYFDTHGQSTSQAIVYNVGFATSNSGCTQVCTNRTVGNTGEVGVSSICAIELAP